MTESPRPPPPRVAGEDERRVLATHMRPSGARHCEERRTKIQAADGWPRIPLARNDERTKERKKEGGTPTDVWIEPPRFFRARARAQRGTRRLSAFHRGSGVGDRTPPLSSGPRFLGRGNAPVPVQRAPRRPVIVPAGRIVRSRPGAECIVPPAGTALAPPSGVPSAEGVLH